MPLESWVESHQFLGNAYESSFESSHFTGQHNRICHYSNGINFEKLIWVQIKSNQFVTCIQLRVESWADSESHIFRVNRELNRINSWENNLIHEFKWFNFWESHLSHELDRFKIFARWVDSSHLKLRRTQAWSRQPLIHSGHGLVMSLRQMQLGTINTEDEESLRRKTTSRGSVFASSDLDFFHAVSEFKWGTRLTEISRHTQRRTRMPILMVTLISGRVDYNADIIMPQVPTVSVRALAKLWLT